MVIACITCTERINLCNAALAKARSNMQVKVRPRKSQWSGVVSGAMATCPVERCPLSPPNPSYRRNHLAQSCKYLAICAALNLCRVEKHLFPACSASVLISPDNLSVCLERTCPTGVTVTRIPVLVRFSVCLLPMLTHHLRGTKCVRCVAGSSGRGCWRVIGRPGSARWPVRLPVAPTVYIAFKFTCSIETVHRSVHYADCPHFASISCA